MLDAFRRGASKFFASLLFLILIASFALWGIPNYTRDFSQHTLARVGDARLSEEDFRRFYDNQLNLFSAQVQQRLTRENARLMYRIQQIQQGNFNADLDREILNLQIGQLVLDQEAKHLGLALSDAAVVEQIRNDPAFQGADKKFSRQVFEERARQAGLTELGLIRDRKAVELREQITDTAVAAVAPSKILVDLAHKYREEQRAVATVTLDPTKLPAVAEPDEAKLKELYETTKRQYVAPETRKIAVLMLTRDDLKARAVVDDAEVKAAWERDKTSWNIPERRRIQQIAFPNKDAAAGIAKEIAGGKSFLLAALEENGAQGRLDQGLLARSGISDPKIAAAAFSLELNQVSQPIETRNGAVLLRVSEIQPGKERTFEEVAKEVREELEQKKQRESATRLHDQIEDLRGAGKTLQQVGDELKIPVRQIEQVDKAGNGPDGKPVLDNPEAGKIIGSAFEGGKDVPREPVELSDGTEAWVEVAAVTPEKQKAFEDVKADVKTAWTTAETRKAMTAAAQALVDRIKGGETIEAVAKSQGVKVEQVAAFKRGQPAAGLPPTAARQAFTLPKGGAGSAETVDGKTRVVFVVTEIKPAAEATKEEAERLSKALAGQMQGDARMVLLGALRNRIGVSVDETVYKRAIGEQQPQQ